MAFTAVGSYLQTEFVGAGTIALNNQAVGDLILLAGISVDSSTNYVTSITGGGATWTQIGTHFTGVNNAAVATLWQGVVTATGSQTATVNITGGGPSIAVNGNEFSVTSGMWSADVRTNLDSSGTNTWPTLTPAGSGELYFGFAINSGIASSGSTPGYVYTVNAHQDGCAWNLSVSAPSAPVWADSGQRFGTMVLMQEILPPPLANPVAFMSSM
jgi:hypothetical protein